MADVVFVAVICAFFALCVVYIRWCDRIVGGDEFTIDAAAPDSSGAIATLDATPSSEVLV
jgi:hypothetical protein